MDFGDTPRARAEAAGACHAMGPKSSVAKKLTTYEDVPAAPEHADMEQRSLAAFTTECYPRNVLRLVWLQVFALFFVVVGCGTAELEDFCDGAAGSLERRDELARAAAPSVVALYGLSPEEDEFGFCSGVLVAPKVVLTAAHCLHSRGDWRFLVFFEADLLEVGTPIEVASMAEHPTQDLGALVLAHDAPPEIPRARWSSDLVGFLLDPTSEIVGYGAPAGDERKCLRVGEPVSELTFDAFDHDEATMLAYLTGSVCKGDSGGPLVKSIDGKPVVFGILIGATNGEGECGTMTLLSRFRRDDPWLREVVGAEALRIPCPPEFAMGTQATALDCP